MNEMIAPIHHKIYTLFSDDFMFQLNEDEYENLKSQFATSSLEQHGGRREVMGFLKP